MIQNKKIQDELLHLIGFEQGNTGDVKVSADLAISRSGLYFQQAHPLITLANLRSIAPDFDNNGQELDVTAAFKKGTAYSKGSIVYYMDAYYKAVADNASSDNLTNTSQWVITDLFSVWLEKKVRASISKAVNRFYLEKQSSGMTNALCENKTLFDGTGRLTDTITNRNNLVGFEIVPVRAKGVTTKINRICLQFTAPGKYKLYVMHSSAVKPVRTIEVEKQTKGTEWFAIDDLFLPYQSENTDAGGSWYICYRQSELPQGSQAINKDRDWSKGPCKSCSRNEHQSWLAWSKYLEVHPFEIKEDLAEDVDGTVAMWDLSYNDYEYGHNYGLNLDVSIYCDLTDFIIQEQHLFQDVIMKQFAIDMLREFAYNPNVRANRHSINASRTDILYEIDGDSSSMKKSGLSYQLDQAFSAINVSTQGIDRICLTCKNNGIKYRTV